MKPKLLIPILIALILLGFSSDKEINWFIMFQPWKAIALEQRVAVLESELADANVIVNRVNGYDDLQAQIRDLRETRNAIQGQISQLSSATAAANAELNRIRAATASINAMTEAFTPDMGTVECGRFPGKSMEPTFDYNSLVCVTNNASYLQTVSVGDIVIVHSCTTANNVIHRIIGEQDGGWVLKGDGNPLPDVCVTPKGEVWLVVVGITRDAFF